MRRIDPDDPKWTAYVLAELDEKERAAVELELEGSDEAKILVEELRFAANLTKTDLRDAVPSLPLTDAQRETIHSSAGVRRSRRWFGLPVSMWTGGLAAAGVAVIVLAVVINPALRSRLRPEAAPTAALSELAKSASDFGLRYEHPAAPAVPPPPAEPKSLALNPIEAVPQDAVRSGVAQNAAPPPSPTIPVPLLRVPETAALAPPIEPQNKQSQSLEAPTTALQLKEEPAATELFRPASPLGVARIGVVSGTVSGQQAQKDQQGQQRQQVLPQVDERLALSTSFAEVRAPGVPPPPVDRIIGGGNGNAAYASINDNPFLPVAQNPLSTFAADVDTASYSNMRRFLSQNQRPPRDSVRIEELVNYFSYDYPQPPGDNPIGASIEAAAAPWNPQHRLVRIGIKGRDLDARRRPAANLVFLLDVSGSMQPQERLPLLKDSLRMLIDQLTPNDQVTVVTYAGTTGVALRPTRGDQKDVIRGLIDSLQAGGSTNGASGIQLAYEQATANFIPGGVNRVILATDGDFNVGITDRNALLRLIEEKAKSGVFLSVLGVGMGNYKDATLEMLADKGHGNYAYLDTLNEARKVLVEQMNGTLVTVAKDVKIQVEFNPAVVDAYRLIGYENRALRNEDFNNDQKDAGDVGAGHTVTVLYEVVPRGVAIGAPGVDGLKYQPAPPPPAPNASNETLNLKIRYKEPSAADSKLLVFPLVDREQNFARASVDFRFAAAVASFGMILRDSPYKGTATIESVLGMAEDSIGSDRNGYRREFLQLVQRARQVRGR